MVSIADEARTNMLTELGLAEPQLLTNVDLMRLLLEGDEGLSNLVQNPNFINDISNWVVTNDTIADVVHDTGRFNQDAGSLKLTAVNPGAINSVSYRPSGSQRPSVVAGNTYQASVWVWMDTPWPDVTVPISWHDNLGGVLSTVDGPFQNINAGEWTFISQTAVAPALSVTASPQFRLEGPPPDGTIAYTDNYRFFDETATGSFQTLHRPLVGTSVGTEYYRYLRELRDS